MHQNAVVSKRSFLSPRKQDGGVTYELIRCKACSAPALTPATPVASESDVMLQFARRHAHLQLLNEVQVGWFDRPKED